MSTVLQTSDSSDCAPQATSDKLGICQWFHFNAEDDLARGIELLQSLGARHLRTGVSWADYHRPHGKQWYRRQMRALEKFDVLLSVWHTPPSLASGGTCASPPRRLADYADFVAELIEEHGDSFNAIELWNEPNNLYKWDFTRYDPDWRKFGEMVARAGSVARSYGKPTILGGMMPVDHEWLKLMKKYGALDAVDVVGIHSFPDMWWSDHPNWDWRSHWHGWEQKIAYIRRHAEGKPVWVTETGLATWDVYRQVPARHRMQAERLKKALAAPADRIYWYSLLDLDPARDAIEGFHVDENEYHLGLVNYDGCRKPAWHVFTALMKESRALPL